MAPHLALFVPVIVHPDMFAWGVRCLSYAVKTEHPDTRVDVNDLRYNRAFVEFWADVRRSLKDDLLEVMAELYREAKKPEPFYWQPDERMFHYMSGFLLLASDPARRAAQPGKLAELVEKRQREADQMLARMDELLAPFVQTESSSLVLGVSIYQYLLLHGVLLASRLRKLAPKATVLLGGDPLDGPTSEDMLRAHPWLDGCVVGPGEYVLNEILATIKAGKDVRQVPMTRLVNDAFMVDPKANLAAWNQVLETRSDYDAVKGYHGVEWNAATESIHILGRRGCAWAGCTFCQRMHVITKEFVFDPSLSLMQREILRLLTEYYAGRLGKDAAGTPHRDLYEWSGNGRIRIAPSKSDEPLLIRFDADDAEVSAVVDILAWLDKQIPAGKQVRFYSYAPARQMARPEIHSIAKAYDPKRLLVNLGVPIETLNGKTTITMKKGGHPIGSIKAMKVAADADASYSGLYFSFYPLEGLEDVKEECYFLDRSLHLVAGNYAPGIYVASSRDPIGQDPEKYGIALYENGDPVMKLLGMKSGASHIEAYRLLANTAESRMQTAYISVVNAVGEFAYGFRQLALIKKLVRSLPEWMWRQARIGDFVYTRRLLYVLTLVLAGSRSRRAVIKPQLYIRDGVLVRKRVRFLGESWTRKLTANELALLRYLYQQRKIAEVKEQFAANKEMDVERMIDEFDKLGVIVRYGTMVMCVANDPEGLRLLAKEADLEKFREKYAKLDNGVGNVVEGNLYLKDRSLAKAQGGRVRLAVRY